MSKEKFSAVAPFLLVDGVLIFAIITLLQLDWIVNHTLYNYNLHFSFNWAVPYWAFLRTSLSLLTLAVTAVSILGYVYYRNFRKERERVVYICESCGNAWIELDGSFKINRKLPKFKILKSCPSCNKKLLDRPN